MGCKGNGVQSIAIYNLQNYRKEIDSSFYGKSLLIYQLFSHNIVIIYLELKEEDKYEWCILLVLLNFFFHIMT